MGRAVKREKWCVESVVEGGVFVCWSRGEKEDCWSSFMGDLEVP
jgi:hypothetical protein